MNKLNKKFLSKTAIIQEKEKSAINKKINSLKLNRFFNALILSLFELLNINLKNMNMNTGTKVLTNKLNCGK